METNVELILFLIVGLMAMASAAMMLISENAVHSALFLIINFACVAFLYLMLNAAFLAMVQITVYAGAIMVLFMFVIMLLGSERLAPEVLPRFPWLTRAALALTLFFLAFAGYFIIESEISTHEPEPLQPMVQVINSVPDFESVDIYLNDERIAEEVEFREASEYVELPAGNYTLSFVGHSDEAETTEGDPVPLSVVNREVPDLTLEENQTLSLILIPVDVHNTYGVLPVERDINTVEHKYQTNVQIVHAAPAYGPIDFADITEQGEEPRMVVENLAYGEVSDELVLREGERQYGVYETGRITEALANTAEGETITVNDVDTLKRMEKIDFTGNTSTLYIVTPPVNREIAGQPPDVVHFTEENRPAFGGPTSVGMRLYTTYMLPFQAIALLLLVAMVGAIVLTRDAIQPVTRKRERRLATSSTPLVGESSQD